MKKGGSSVSDCFQKFKTFADTLAVVGQPVSDFEHVSFFFFFERCFVFDCNKFSSGGTQSNLSPNVLLNFWFMFLFETY